MRKYIEDLLKKYFDGEKQEGKSPKCESSYTYGTVIRLSFSESVLYSYLTPIAYKDDCTKIVYLSDEKYSLTTQNHQNGVELMASRYGYSVVRVNERELCKFMA